MDVMFVALHTAFLVSTVTYQCPAPSANQQFHASEALESSNWANQLLTAEDADKISISFNNPTDPKFELKYNYAKRPFSWDPTSDMRVLNFTDEMGGVFDENFLPETIDQLPPFLKNVTPEKGSFELDLTSRTYKLVYSKPI